MKLFVVLAVVFLTLLCSQAWAYEESRKCIRKNNNVEICTIRTIQYRRGSLSRRSCPYFVDANGKVQCKIIRRQMNRRLLRRACWRDENGKCRTPEEIQKMHGK
ncbi:hypothetical protein Q1695_005462 [Nippostrongylus brasiliensis]|nr:hypothetical protein Q1695_005462 [Nippostrongylus brasiliensis]